jgi:hypothetical protein
MKDFGNPGSLGSNSCWHCGWSEAAMAASVPMKAVLHRDDLVGAATIFLSQLASELDCSLNCFRPAVGEKYAM